jgi:hypothetical protein
MKSGKPIFEAKTKALLFVNMSYFVAKESVIFSEQVNCMQQALILRNTKVLRNKKRRSQLTKTL